MGTIEKISGVEQEFKLLKEIEDFKSTLIDIINNDQDTYYIGIAEYQPTPNMFGNVVPKTTALTISKEILWEVSKILEEHANARDTAIRKFLKENL